MEYLSIQYEGVLLKLERLPNGKYKKPRMSQFIPQSFGCTWLDDCRIPTTKEHPNRGRVGETTQSYRYTEKGSTNFAATPGPRGGAAEGRFPANVLVSTAPDVDVEALLNLHDRLQSGNVELSPAERGDLHYLGLDTSDLKRMTRAGLEKHIREACDPLNDGTTTKSPRSYRRSVNSWDTNKVYGSGIGEHAGVESLNFGDAGSPSRYFDLDAWWTERIGQLPSSVQKTFPNLLVAKPSAREKNAGLDKLPLKSKPQMGEFKDNPGCTTPKSSPTPRGNFHPTVKPVKLFSYLVTLGSREGDVVLDPYMGSGTTGCAAIGLNRNFLGCDLDAEYIEIAKHRIRWIRRHGLGALSAPPKSKKKPAKQKSAKPDEPVVKTTTEGPGLWGRRS